MTALGPLDGTRIEPALPTVLIVDDEARTRALVHSCLSPWYRVLEAEDGEHALDLLAREPVDAVLLDVMLPGRNGFDICVEIKKHHAQTLLPVVMLTALSDQESRNAGLQVGADEFLSKPIDRRELQLRVHAIIRLRQQQAQIELQLQALRTANELKDDLFSLIVHDLRTPLTVLKGLLDLMQPGAGSALTRDLADAQRCVSRLDELVEEVLTVSELEAGHVRVAMAPCDVTTVVQRALATVSPAARLADVPLTLTQVPTRLVAIHSGLVQRAVENLLGNALRYSGGTGVEVDVRDEVAGVIVEVADRGPGVPDEHKALIFQKFNMPELSRSRGRRGFGLGLYLVQLVAQVCRGSAEVRDRPGGGAIFRIVLPGLSDNTQAQA